MAFNIKTIVEPLKLYISKYAPTNQIAVQLALWIVNYTIIKTTNSTSEKQYIFLTNLFVFETRLAG